MKKVTFYQATLDYLSNAATLLAGAIGTLALIESVYAGVFVLFFGQTLVLMLMAAGIITVVQVFAAGLLGFYNAYRARNATEPTANDA